MDRLREAAQLGPAHHRTVVLVLGAAADRVETMEATLRRTLTVLETAERNYRLSFNPVPFQVEALRHAIQAVREQLEELTR
ncbi:hypothetical protein CLG85_001445 [Yangia mangrovi]|uniref:Uncharacterized protein n=1 Tax=Alloyangia mangrovi TaxID=1779329 RepID=A0ABT2KH99_9RHOB|nr:hypothetical protein [Alloyangia mangrovi]MCT4369073.1 hypothetical protein [Alloyangia mangrovi]